ncbi:MULTISPECIES: AAA family ATPase [unclassified Roseovarius]|uniref:AAA family ATPase n=1 Tax=unclassified Roseovarius TaxID=2614913 RepID=UPI00273F5B9C|nr:MULTISPECIES: AAA family ATPase [unclassified Roseovarius]
MRNRLFVSSLKISNFKGIASLELNFDPALTVIAGSNGVGKTSILEAVLATATQVWVSTERGSKYPIFHLDLNSRRRTATKGKIEAHFRAASEKDTEYFELCFEEHLGTRHLRQMGDYVKRQKDMETSLIVYYSQERIADRKQPTSRGNRDSSLKTSVTSVGEFENWFFERESDEAREVQKRKDFGFSYPELDAIRSVLEQMENFDSITSRYDENQSARKLLFIKNGIEVLFDELSSGERVYFLLAADLARRLSLEYPSLPMNERPGLVLIDEVELHLHPAWQRKILTELLKSFPACQFIVTTHSPQVMGGVNARNIRVLNADSSGHVSVRIPSASKGRDTNYILEALLDTSERELDVDELFESFDQAYDKGDLESTKSALEQIEAKVEGESSLVATLRSKFERKFAAQ